MSLFFDLFRCDPNVLDLEEGQFLFHEGDDSNGDMYVLVSGNANVLIGGRAVETIGVGDIVGEMALIEQRAARSASVQADTDCSFVVIDEKRFNYLVTEAPQFAIEVMRVIAGRLRKADQAMSRQDPAERITWQDIPPLAPNG